MINPELLRRNPESIKLSLSRRNEEVSIVDELIGIDIQRRKIISEIELKIRQNQGMFRVFLIRGMLNIAQNMK